MRRGVCVRVCLGEACDHNSRGDLVSAGPGRGPRWRVRLCDQLHFMRETDDGQAHLGFCCFAFLQRSKFQKLLSNHKYLLTIILGH